MRMRLGRPDLRRYASRFDVPPAMGDVAVTFLGVSTLFVDDGRSSVLVDGFFSRPSMRRVTLGRLAPDAMRVDIALNRLGCGNGRRVNVVVPVHSHYDHAMDAALVAERTGAVLLGGESVANLRRGHGLPDGRSRVVSPGEVVTCGAFTLTFVESAHCPPDRFPGAITRPVVPPVRARAYRCGEAWSLLLRHDSGRTALVQGSAGFVPGALAGRRADLVYLGVGQLGIRDEAYIRRYWSETVERVRARRVVLTHWDDFFRSLDRPLRALPYAGDDLDVTMRVLGTLADEQGVALHLPRPWRREDPWVGMGGDR
jgi:L-ascorbate metabolism protein UlaG (beta-lactamase superfamily)